MRDNTPIVRDLVLVGGGHSHIAVLRSFGMKPLPGVRLTVIGREVDTPYSGMLPGLVAGHYGFDEAHIDLFRLANFARARFVHAEATGVDVDSNRVLFADRPDLPFDLLSINTGSAPSRRVPGSKEHAVPVKPIDRFYRHWHRVIERAKETDVLRIAVVGGGAAGVELALATEFALRPLTQITVSLVATSSRVPDGHHHRVQERLERVLADRGIEVAREHRVEQVEHGRLRCSNGQEIAADEIFWVTNAGAPGWPRSAGLDVDDDGFIAVNDFLQSTSHPHVFAAGDVASMVNHPRSKSGVLAVRQGPPLTDNLRRYLTGRKLDAFSPQRKMLALIGTGDGQAVASRGRLAADGRKLWRLKDQIDRRFMRKYNDLPEMPAPASATPADGIATTEQLRALTALTMRCSGCGSKVGKSVLSRVLADLPRQQKDDVLAGLDEADDAAVTDLGNGRLLVQTIDGFRSFIDDEYTFGRVAATHALSDAFAMGATPHSALVWAQVPIGLEEKVEAGLRQLMAGTERALADADCALTGGHTSEGPVLAMGLSITAFAEKKELLTKRGLVPGQSLVLTKKLGTGTLFAAAMRGAAKGRWLIAAIESMLQSNQRAASIIRAHSATAMTDVTGFGLLGHLYEMLTASGVCAELVSDALPVLDGALDTLSSGIQSSLAPDNARLRRALANREDAASNPLLPLLFDPQTSGGLLAGVSKESAEACCAALCAAGFQAAVIGSVIDGPSSSIVLR